MKKYNKKLILYISVTVGVLSSLASAGITANAEYDEYVNYYEPYYYEYDYNDNDVVTDSYIIDDSQYIDDSYYDPYADPYGYDDPYESETTEYEESSEISEVSEAESSLEMSVDSSELTSKDWQELQESLNSTFHMNPSKSLVSGSDNAVFQDIKEDSSTDDNNTNDTWIFLAWGIGLIAIGVFIILMVIVTTLRTKRKMRQTAEKYTKRNHMEDILSDENIQKKLDLQQNKDKK